MNDFQFQNTTKVYFGKDQLGHLHEEVLKYGKSVLVVYGGGSIKKIGLYDKVIKELKRIILKFMNLQALNQIQDIQQLIKEQKFVKIIMLHPFLVLVVVQQSMPLKPLRL